MYSEGEIDDPRLRGVRRQDAAAAERNASAALRARSSRPSVLLFAVIVVVETVGDILCDGYRRGSVLDRPPRDVLN